jgi:hypothetical protein
MVRKTRLSARADRCAQNFSETSAMRPIATFALIAALATVSGLAAANAQSRGYGRHDGGFVTAESRNGHGSVSGPVRLGRAGSREVRLPGGTWIACGRSCAETLRVESIDFWENKGAGQGRTDNACGIFGCLSRGFGF